MKIVSLVSSGTGSPGWSRKKGRKTVVVVVVVCDKMNQRNMLCTPGFMDDAMWPSGPHVGYSKSMPHSLIAFTITWPLVVCTFTVRTALASAVAHVGPKSATLDCQV